METTTQYYMFMVNPDGIDNKMNFIEKIKFLFSDKLDVSFNVPIIVKSEREWDDIAINGVTIRKFIQAEKYTVILPKGYKIVKEDTND